ncbi:hypothetical protein [Streptomyces sp. CB02923]|uniref:hypothetical protein n=1 Tax=Streptomyces sp. CB02923 TaxID=1718985 RepID=UPI0018FFAFA8|nr:hypothetical protein [Streptomyces sp. CB02923]
MAVRRVLLAGLFLAGFVALGFAFGGGAHAVDGPVGVEQQLGASSSAVPQTSVKASAAGAGRELKRGGGPDADTMAGTPVVGKAVRPVAERTVPAAGQAAEPVTEPVTAPVRDVVRDVRRAGDAGALPVELPGRLPGTDDGDDADNGHGDGRGEQPGRGSGPQRGAGQQHAGADGEMVVGGLNSTLGKPSSTGLRDHLDVSTRSAQSAGSASEHQSGQGQGQGQGHGSLPALPGQFPQGLISSASHTAGDGHGPRNGDQFAAVPAGSAHFGLVPGGVLAAAEPPTRRRAAEILEFPG